MKTKIMSAVMSAMMLTLASVGGITASAAEAATAETSAITETTTVSAEKTGDEKPTETTEIQDTSFVSESHLPDFYGDDYYDTKGNATLIKSEHIIYNTEEMQFIAVTTKDGNVFYVLINYSADSGEDSVYFLNKVDSIDLYSLIYMTDDEKENGINMDNVKKAENAAITALGKDKPASDTGDSDTAEAHDGTEDSPSEHPVNKPMNMNSIYLVFGAIALIGVGAVAFFIMKKKKGNNVRTPEFDPDEEYNNDDELDMFNGNDED